MNSVFEENIPLLNELFGNKMVSEKLDLFRFIFENTETSWLKNLERLRNQQIKYLLICEAPPYSETKIPVYFYNQFDSAFNRKIWKAFFPGIKFPANSDIYFEKLADSGFLLIDNLPFPANYKAKRKNKTYTKLLKNSLNWFIQKLNSEKITIAENLKIAFGFKVNALKFIEITDGVIHFNEQQTFIVNKEQIVVNGSGFPSAKNLNKIFFPDYKFYNYYNGEKENPFHTKGDFELNFDNPKSLFWYYEKNYHCGNDNITESDFKNFIENLIHGKLSEYFRNDYDLWKLYFDNAVK